MSIKIVSGSTIKIAGNTIAMITFHDRLYGLITFTDAEAEIFRTPEMSRLRHLSLSAVPPWLLPAGTCASKFEHTVGVCHLVKVLTTYRPEFKELAKEVVQDLFFAAAAHDLGTAPFSHVSELFQLQIMKQSHEEYAARIIESSAFAEVVEKQGSSIHRITRLILGQHPPWSDLINGSIDLDNLDNTLRFGWSLGIFQALPYLPQELVKAFTIKNGETCLDGHYTQAVAAWEKTREVVYDFVHSTANLSPGTMLVRALDFAHEAGELSVEYFHFTDEQAWNYLATRCNKITQQMIELLELWQFYPLVYEWEKVIDDSSGSSLHTKRNNADVKTGENTHTSKDIRTGKLQKALADHIAAQLHIARECVSTFLAYDKGFKRIHLPMFGVGERKTSDSKTSLSPSDTFLSNSKNSQPRIILKVFLHPKYETQKKKVSSIVADWIEEVKLT